MMVMANSSCKFCYLKSSSDIQEQKGKFFMGEFIVFGRLLQGLEMFLGKIKCGVLRQQHDLEHAIIKFRRHCDEIFFQLL
jgi:hypothetical protein